MINTLIFDFGDVFINLDKQGAMNNALKLFRCDTFDAEMINTNTQYEIGQLSTQQFLDFYTTKFNQLSSQDVLNAWNFIIKDFPKYRLTWLQNLVISKNYKLILLSNTNEAHIEYIKQNITFYDEFKSCFDCFYLSYEIGLRKPNTDIFEFALVENNLQPETCLFIDDTKENTDTAKTLGIQIWNIDETSEDIVTLFDTKSQLF